MEQVSVTLNLYLYRRKTIRNRFHLWLFLTKNPSLTEFRVHESNESSSSDGGEGDNNEDEGDLEVGNEETKEEVKESQVQENIHKSEPYNQNTESVASSEGGYRINYSETGSKSDQFLNSLYSTKD